MSLSNGLDEEVILVIKKKKIHPLPPRTLNGFSINHYKDTIDYCICENHARNKVDTFFSSLRGLVLWQIVIAFLQRNCSYKM